jgi:hypothetical protein
MNATVVECMKQSRLFCTHQANERVEEESNNRPRRGFLPEYGVLEDSEMGSGWGGQWDNQCLRLENALQMGGIETTLRNSHSVSNAREPERVYEALIELVSGRLLKVRTFEGFGRVPQQALSAQCDSVVVVVVAGVHWQDELQLGKPTVTWPPVRWDLAKFRPHRLSS